MNKIIESAYVVSLIVMGVVWGFWYCEQAEVEHYIISVLMMIIIGLLADCCRNRS